MLKNSELPPRRSKDPEEPREAQLWVRFDGQPYDPRKDEMVMQDMGYYNPEGAAMNLARFFGRGDPKNTPYTSGYSGKKMPMAVAFSTLDQALELWNINRKHEFSHLVSIMVRDQIFAVNECFYELSQKSEHLRPFSHFDEILAMMVDYFFENEKGDVSSSANCEDLINQIFGFYRKYATEYFRELNKGKIKDAKPEDIGSKTLKYHVAFLHPEFRDVIRNLVYAMEEWLAYLWADSKYEVTTKLEYRRNCLGLITDRSETALVIDEADRSPVERVDDYILVDNIKQTLVDWFAFDDYEYLTDRDAIIEYVKKMKLNVGFVCEVMDISPDDFYQLLQKKVNSSKNHAPFVSDYESWAASNIGYYEYVYLMNYMLEKHKSEGITIFQKRYSASTQEESVEESKKVQDYHKILNMYHQWLLSGQNTKKHATNTRKIFQSFAYANTAQAPIVISKTRRNLEYSNRLMGLCQRYIQFIESNETHQQFQILIKGSSGTDEPEAMQLSLFN